MSEGPKGTPQRPAVERKDSKQKQPSSGGCDGTTGASKGQPKTKAKAKQFSEKENKRKVETRDGRTEANAGAKASPGKKTGGAEGPGVSTARKEAKSPPGSLAGLPGTEEKKPPDKGREKRHGGQRGRGGNKSAKSPPDADTRGTGTSGAKTPDNRSKSATATGSTRSLANTNASTKQFGGKGKDKKHGQAVDGNSQTNGAAKSSPDKETRGAKGATGTTSKKHPSFPSQVKNGHQQPKGKGNENRRSRDAPTKPRLTEKDTGSLISSHKNRARKTSQKHCPPLNCNEIRQLIKKDPLQIVERLSQSITTLQKILNLKDAQNSCEDFTYDIIHVLAKACEAPSTEQLNSILAALKNSAFIGEGVSRCLDGVQLGKGTSEKLDRRLLEDLIKLFLTYLRRLPSSFADVPIQQMQSALELLQFEGKDDTLVKLANLKEERKNAIEEYRERTKSHKRRNASHGQPPNDFREIPLCPSISEVTTDEKPFLRKHVKKGRFDDVEHYLDVQFRLLREDFLSPLREGIAEVVQKVPRHECQQKIKLYNAVRILGKEYTKRGIFYKVQFDASPFIRTRWESSRRLIFGSFLCLSNDNFKTMLFATVANRDPQKLKKGQFDIHFIEGQDVYRIQKRNEVYVMAESPAYFESCRHVLSGLKEMDEENLPFMKYLVECNPDVDPPQYLRREDGKEPVRYDLGQTLKLPYSGTVAVLQSEEWPCAKDVSLNESQLEAFKTALTREFSVIQGPPGTGKTFVGAKIVQCLLHNRRVWDPGFVSPMLMVCYTNHALDQFLEKVLEFLRVGIIRVGGRSKSQQLERFNLKLFVRRYSSEKRWNMEHKMRMSVKEIEDKERTLRSLERVILSFEHLEKVMDERHADQFYEGIEGTTNTEEVFKIWICHKETKNATAGNGIVQEKSRDKDDAGDTCVRAEEDDGDNEEEGDKSVDAVDCPWPVVDPSRTSTVTATTTMSGHVSAKSTTERQCTGNGNTSSLMQTLPGPIQPPHGPPDADGLTGAVLSWKDKRELAFDQVTFEETTTRNCDFVQPSARISTDRTTHHVNLAPERHFMEGPRKEHATNTPETTSRDHEPSTSIQNDRQFLLTSNHDKDLEMSSDLAREDARPYQDGCLIDEAVLHYLMNPAADELEEETIEIEYEANLLQGQRYLAGEEDDFLPLGAVSHGEDEGVDYQSSDGDDEEREDGVSQSALSYENSLQVENQYFQNSDKWLSPNGENSSHTNALRYEANEAHIETREAAVPLQTEIATTTGEDNKNNVTVNYGINDGNNKGNFGSEMVFPTQGLQRGVTAQNPKRLQEMTTSYQSNISMVSGCNASQGHNGQHIQTTIGSQNNDNNFRLDCASNDEAGEDDYGWETVLPKRRSKQSFPGDHNASRGHRNQSRKKSKTISGKNLKEANARLKKERMMSEEEVREVKDIWMLSTRDRGKLYRYWLNCYRELCIVDIQREELAYEKYCTTLRKIEGEEEEEALRKATVIGMTTSCAARYHDILIRIRPRIVVIEEAAEVLEAHIVTSLTPRTQHVIMIGDHKQLRPKATVYELAQKYNLQISLFERMVLNKMDCKRLSTQHRMRPEIAQLTKRIYDHDIMDHTSVCHFKDVRGLHENLFFVDHLYPEKLVSGLQSYSNKHEADFTVALCRYLLQQGYKPEQITVLTMYTGQLLELKQAMPRKPFEGVKISVVDNFQGEENDIILLSLVRSSTNEGRIGFLRESNRICVALSRARQGFYCVGNFTLLSTHCELWKEICDDMRTKEKMTDALKLVCKKHGKVVEVRTSEDFAKCPYGGCGNVCEDRLDCGHTCGRLCDPLDPMHQTYKCRRPCPKQCDAKLHSCNKLCHDPYKCSKCTYKVIKIMTDCKHEQEAECGTDVSEIICRQKCEKVLPCNHPCRSICGSPCEVKKCKVKVRRTLDCEHEIIIPCHTDPENAVCKAPVEVLLSCGHPKTVECRNKDAPGNCIEKCTNQLSCGHKCPGACIDDCSSLKCEFLFEANLPCGHLQNVRCADYPNNIICQSACEKPCIRDHPCKQRCHEGSECNECTEVITFEMPGCGHQKKIRCSVDTSILVCQRKCTRKRQCGHRCKDKCGNPCEAEPCEVPVSRTLPCNHEVKLACHENPEEHACDVMVDRDLPCGHQTKTKCHVQLHDVFCQAVVEAQLPCEHFKNVACALVPKGLQGVSCNVMVTRVLPCCHSQEMQCSAEIRREICRAACEKTLDCKHPCPGRCGDDCTKFRCQREVKKPLPCGHYVAIKCCEDVRDISCQKRCTTVLRCGHQCPGKCFENCKQQLCQEKVLKRFPCQYQHQSYLFCCVDVASLPCPTKVRKTFPCGHSKMLACETATNATCKLQCKRKRPCKHRCQGFCGEPCSKYPCEERINKRLPCGHIAPVRCCDPPEAVKCPAPCGVTLDCGHACTGQCFWCRRRGYHEECQHPCSRRLVCSHRCQAPCSVPCPPCTKTCDRRCAHDKCRNRCLVDCEPCRMPCERNCLHYPCNYLCNELCDRRACDAPCAELLQCGHPCIGLCGENCPTLCRKCDASKLSAFCSENVKDERVRFLQLVDCGHIIEVGRMDKWIHSQRNVNNVQPRQCPSCSAPITYSMRYGNTIKRSLEDVCRVNKEAQKDASGVKEDIHALEKEIGKNGNVLPLNHFPYNVRRLVQPVYNDPWSCPRKETRSVESSNLAYLYSLKNNLGIIADISRTLQTIKSTSITFIHAKGNLSQSQQSDIQSILDGSQRILHNTEQRLAEPEMNLGLLSRLHTHVMKFALAIHLIDAQCKLAKRGRVLMSVVATKLQEQTQRLVVFIRGRPDTIDRTELFNTVNSLRQELRLAPLPAPQPIRLLNFPGFSRDSWFKCEKGHVYALRKIVCDGRVTEERECRRCVESSATGETGDGSYV